MSTANRAALEALYYAMLPLLSVARSLDATLYRNLNSASVQLARVLGKTA